MIRANLLRPIRNLVHSLANHGWSGSLRRLLRRTRPEDRGPDDFAPADQPHPFDLQHGTETGGYAAGATLRSGHAAADFYNTAYYGISPSTLHAALDQLPEPVAPFTFVDLGCGKGRALLLAAMHGFRSVLGVEISPELCEVARRNMTLHNNAEVLACDASQLRYPAGPLVIFLYHPFLAPLLRRVLRNLRQQLAAAPRTCYLLYANPVYEKIVDGQHAMPVWDRTFALSPEDAAADRHGIATERYRLWQMSR